MGLPAMNSMTTASAEETNQDSASEEVYEVSGTLTDSDGNALANYTLTVEDTAAAAVEPMVRQASLLPHFAAMDHQALAVTVTVITDANGNYTLRLGKSTFTITVKDSGGNSAGTFELTVNTGSDGDVIATPTVIEGTIQVNVEEVKLAIPRITYPSSSYTFAVNSAITELTPSISGSVDTCTVSPALPAGLSLNGKTCVISGTPTTEQAATSYTVTATNTAGSGTASFTIAIAPASAAAEANLTPKCGELHSNSLTKNGGYALMYTKYYPQLHSSGGITSVGECGQKTASFVSGGTTGTSIAKTYDAAGRLSTLTYVTAGKKIKNTYTYNTDGYLTSMIYQDLNIDYTSKTLFEYDAAGRIIKMGHDTATLPTGSDFYLESTFTYSHATEHWPVTQKFKTFILDGSTYLLNYDGEMTITPVFNSDGLMTSYTSTGSSTSYSYDPGGTQSSSQTISDDSSTFSYDSSGNVTQTVSDIKYTYSDSSTSSRKDTTTYTYNSTGQLLTLAYSSTSGALLPRNETYTYDSSNRLESLVAEYTSGSDISNSAYYYGYTLTAPASISYPNPSVTLNKNMSYAGVGGTPVISGYNSGCTASPALPSGLQFGDDCSISGTPTISAAATDYTISVHNAEGSASTTLSISVN